MKPKILITSALPYVNNVPHLGNIIGCVLSADVFARYQRARGKEVLYVCGTDEHGTATETKALEEGLTPQQICDKYHKIHKEIYEWFGCSFDVFGRTSSVVHTEVTQSIFKRIHENGFIKPDILEQLYCPKCDKFLADRFVGGTCPKCGHEDARGDQCDKCGNLLNAIELVNPKCRVCDSKPVKKTSKHLFLDLPKLGSDLQKWVEKQSEIGNWTANAKKITSAWFKEGLKQRCISRDLKWGVNIPLDGYRDKVFYVWFDAPIGYISITKNEREDWAEWWQNPDDVKLYQFMAKDNIPFHTIIFPSTLLATHDKWTMLHHINSTEYLNYETGKFSKSLGTGVFGDGAKNSGIPADVWRYYLLANRPEGSDTQFSWNDFQEKNNNELLANLGNFVNRALVFTYKNFDGAVPKKKLTELDDKLISDVNQVIKKYIELLDSVKEKDALREVMKISRLGNQYFQENAPWTLIKETSSIEEKERCGTVLNMCCNLVYTLSILIEPFLPHTSQNILSQMNMTSKEIEYKMHLDLEPGHKIGKPFTLFKKIEDDDVKKFRTQFGGDGIKKSKKKEIAKFETFPADLRVGIVESVDDHPDAGKLYIMKVNVGNGEIRQVVAGLKAYISRDMILGKHLIVVCNLKPVKLRGMVSEGMLLAADEKNKVVVLEAPNSDAGDEVTLKGVPSSEPFEQLEINQFTKLVLEVDADSNVVCKNFGKKLKTPVEYVVVSGVGEGAKIR